MNLEMTDGSTGASPLDTRHPAFPPAREPLVERTSPEDAQRAVLNILDDFLNERAHLQGTQRAVLNILEDFDSERIKVEKSVGELKRSNNELQQFAYVASHDLQEPLRMVASYTQLLAKRYQGRLDPDADEFIAYAVDGCNRMQGLIQDLLAYSRAGTDGKELCEISSEKALKDAVANLRATIEESAAVLTHDALPAITTDDAQLALVFQNLRLTNLLLSKQEQTLTSKNHSKQPSY
jgi:light-regulated signal transduction histidine kinase (bacteriophytochrome)